MTPFSAAPHPNPVNAPMTPIPLLVHRVVRLLAVICLTGVAGSVLAKDKEKNREASRAEYLALFADHDPLKIRIELSTNAMAVLEAVPGGFGQPGERENVVGTVREGDQVYHGVQIHLKGAAGSFRPVNDKPAFTLSFDKHVKSQRFHGLRKVSLNNSVQDPTYVSEQLCRELFLASGVPTPRATQARVELNGRDLGFYVVVEGWDRDFLGRHFKDPTGTLYDGGFVRDVGETLSVNVGDPKSNQADRKALVAALDEPDPAKRIEWLRQVLDFDRFLSLMAMEVIVWDWDGYPMNRNNWRLYYQPATGKLVFMPHGMDQMFWKPEASILPRMEGRVAQAVMENRAARQAYVDRLRELNRTVFDVPRWTNRVQQIADRIRPHLPASETDGYLDRIADLRNSMAVRGESLTRQLSHPVDPVAFDTNGLASLSGWKSKGSFGAPHFSPEQAPERGKPVAIAMLDGSSIGVWRTGVWLERGRYKLEGRVKLRDVTPDPGDTRGGAGLQVEGNRMEKPILGTADWQPIEMEFSVGDSLAETQLACELRAAGGEAWFDLDAFRLRRMPGNGDDVPARRIRRGGGDRRLGGE